jgi:hypothetical protein
MYDLGASEDYWADVWAGVFDADAGTAWLAFPPFVLMYRSLAFMAATLALAEVCARRNPLLQPRDVPAAITAAVVLAGLAIIFADWGFGQLLLRCTAA